MLRHSLSNQEISAINSLLDDITSRYDSAEDDRFLHDVPVFAQELPRSIRKLINDYKLRGDASGILLISDYPVDEGLIGKTPEHWATKRYPTRAFREEVLLILLGSLLGYLFGWATQQGGHIVHEVYPIKGHENEQLGTGSEELLTWHSEDAFHPYRGDFLGMVCLRNTDKVSTMVASIDGLRLDEEQIKTLFEPRFIIRPDESHLEKNRLRDCKTENGSEDQVDSSYQKINQMNNSPEKIPVLFGHPESPYWRLDPYFMDRLEDDKEAQDALDALIEAVDANIWDLVLHPGDFCFLDNFKVVHGRRPFKARYDGSDRWLKRINITSDLRKSRGSRCTSTSRLIA